MIEENQMSSLDALIQLSQKHYGKNISPPDPLKGDGSDRQIYRFRRNDNTSWIGVTHSDRAENEAFIYLSRHFAKKQIPVPKVYAVDLDKNCYLIEDLGDIAMADLLTQWKNEHPPNKETILAAYGKVFYWLPRIQFHGSEGLDYSLPYMSKELNGESFSLDIKYFKDYFWNLFASDYHTNANVDNDLSQLIQRLEQIPRHVFVYRDFQSRNIIWKNDSPYFIDYQSGSLGSIYYDVASALYASKAGIDEQMRLQIIDIYLEELRPFLKVDREKFLDDLYQFVLVRRLRSLGTYGFLPSQKGKMYFLDSIPDTINEIEYLLNHYDVLKPWKALHELFKQWKQDSQLCSKPWLHQYITKIHQCRSQ